MQLSGLVVGVGKPCWTRTVPHRGVGGELGKCTGADAEICPTISPQIIE